MNTTPSHSRLTLVSALSEGKPSIVAEVLIKQKRTVQEVREFSNTLSKAVGVAAKYFKEEEQQKAREEKERQKNMTEQQKAEQLIQQQTLAGINAAKAVFLQTLISGGMPEDKAQEMVDSEFSHAFPMGKVLVQFRGKKFETSLKGNANSELRNALKATGMTRRQFIQNFAVHQ